MIPYWQNMYSPLHDISDSIYINVLAPPTIDELTDLWKSLPNGKAAGPSCITYKMLKHMGPIAIELLLDIFKDCFTLHTIPSRWKQATIYSIPKPTE